MKNVILCSLLLLLASNCLICYVKAADNDTDRVWLMEKGEERDLLSRPLPPLALRVKPAATEEPDADAPDDEEPGGLGPQDGGPCKPDLQPTHPKNDPGTAMGKCFIPDSQWSKACQAVMAVNKHYDDVASKVDRQEVERAVEAQQAPLRHTSCKEQDDSTLMTECRSCTIQLKPNSFGVQLTCYECQRGRDDKTCHHIIKENSKFIVSTTFFEMHGFDLSTPGEEKEEASAEVATKEREKRKEEKDKKKEEEDQEKQ